MGIVPSAHASNIQETNMKSLIATALIAVGLLSIAISAQAASVDDYPGWARNAFEQGRNG